MAIRKYVYIKVTGFLISVVCNKVKDTHMHAIALFFITICLNIYSRHEISMISRLTYMLSHRSGIHLQASAKVPYDKRIFQRIQNRNQAAQCVNLLCLSKKHDT